MNLAKLWRLISRWLSPPDPEPKPEPPKPEPPAPAPKPEPPAPDPPAPDPKPEPPAPDPSPAIRRPAGNFALQPGDVRRELPTSVLTAPGVNGETIRIRWSELQPSRGELYWAWLDRQVDRCRLLGLPYKLLVMTGAGCAPRWVYRDFVPWDADLATNYRSLVHAMGLRFAADPLLVGVHITGPTFVASAEMHAKGDGKNVVDLPGYSPRLMTEAWGRSIDVCGDAFPGVTCCLSVSGQRDAMPYVTPTVDYAKSRLGKRAAFLHNSLAAKTTPTADHHAMIGRLGRDGYTIGYEMVCPTADAKRFGSPRLADGLAKAAPETSWFDIYPGDVDQLT